MNQENKNTGRIISIDAKLESINPFKEPLTVEKLKSFEGLENLNDDEAKQIVLDIQTLCGIIYDFLIEESEEANSEENNNDKNQQKQAA